VATLFASSINCGPSGRFRRGAPSDAANLREEVIAAKERVMRAIEAVGPELPVCISISVAS
jgi:hypothetical protein